MTHIEHWLCFCHGPTDRSSLHKTSHQTCLSRVHWGFNWEHKVVHLPRRRSLTGHWSKYAQKRQIISWHNVIIWMDCWRFWSERYFSTISDESVLSDTRHKNLQTEPGLFIETVLLERSVSADTPCRPAASSTKHTDVTVIITYTHAAWTGNQGECLRPKCPHTGTRHKSCRVRTSSSFLNVLFEV